MRRLGLAEPEMNGIGGNGFMTVFDKKSGRVWSLPMTGAAPNALTPSEMTPELLNDGMRLGSTSPYPTDVNYVAAGKVPILNNSPVVVLNDGRLAFAFRSVGGETIGQTEFQMLVDLIDFELPVQQAIEAPRFALDAKPNFCRPGSAVTVQVEGHMQAIRIDQRTGTMTAGGGPRRTGYAVGY